MNEPTGEDAVVFRDYATFYDSLYADKDYESECAFLVAVFEAHGLGGSASVLDLGSGTGGHDIPLAGRGYAVTGVDRSSEMAGIAAQKAAAAHVPVDFVVGDVRDVSLGRTFDAVISMFAVMSYQLTNDDLLAAFKTARTHLKPGGLFVFDGWFGPAVLVDQPKVARKTVETSEGDVIERVARPTLDPVAQTVSVDYEVSRRRGELVEHTHEVHAMRFLFARELELLLGLAGLELESLGPFMDLSRAPTVDDWNFSAVATAV